MPRANSLLGCSVSFLALCLAACSTTVNLKATNNSTEPLAARVLIKKSTSDMGSEVDLGTIAPGSVTEQKLTVKHGGSIEVQGTYQDAKVYDSQPRTVLATPDPLPLDLSLTIGAHYLDDSSSLQNITNEFGKLGAQLLPQPGDLNDLLGSLFGALIVVTPASKPGDEPVVHYSISPSVLGVKVVDLATALALVPTVQDQSSVDVTSTVAASLSGAFPFAEFSGSWNSAAEYKMSWTMSGFGYIDKPENPGADLVSQYSKLDASHLAALHAALAQHPGSKLLYVNRMYVLKNANVSVYDGTKVTADSDLKVEVITASGAYSHSNVATDTRAVSNVVLNIQGEEIDEVAAAISAPAPVAHSAALVSRSFVSLTSLHGLVTPASGRVAQPAVLPIKVGKSYTFAPSLAKKLIH